MAESGLVPILDIQDKFATCEICFEEFNNADKSPRILPCLHSFCSQCLVLLSKTSQKVKCPNCRKLWPVKNTIETTFPLNQVLNNLVEYVTMKNKPGKLMCENCENHSNATVRCFDCQQYMCDTCTRYHKKFFYIKQHKIVLISELVNMPQEEFLQQKEMCKQHDYMKLDLFCITCAAAVCSSCVHVSHRDHNIQNLQDVYTQKKTLVSTVLHKLQASTDMSRAHRNKLVEENKTLNTMKDVQLQDIEVFSNKIIKKVKDKARQLTEEVIADVTRQQADRDRQVELITVSESVMEEYALYCQQALSYARAVDFIEMSQDLEKTSKTMIEEQNLVDLPLKEVRPSLKTFEEMNAIFEKTSKTMIEEQNLVDLPIKEVRPSLKTFEEMNAIFEKTMIVFDVSQMRSCIDVTDAGCGQETDVMKVTLLPRDNTLVTIQATIEEPTEGKVEHIEFTPCVAGNVVYKAESSWKLMCEKTVMVRSCIDVTDARCGQESDVMKVTLLPRDNTLVVIQATIEEPTEEPTESKDFTKVEHIEFTPCIAGNMVYKAESTGPHKAFISVQGCNLTDDPIVFHSKDDDSELTRKLIFGVDGQTARYRQLVLPFVEFDRQRLCWDDCSINADDALVNTASSAPETQHPAIFKYLCGVTAKTVMSEPTCYWQTDVNIQVLQSAELQRVAAQVGICIEEHVDDEFVIHKNKHAWCVGVDSCEEHNSLCLYVYSRGVYLCDSPVSDFQRNSVFNITLGFLLDTHRKSLHIIHVNANTLIRTITDIDVSQSLMPVFGVYSPKRFNVKLRVTSATNLRLHHQLLTLLSSLVQQ